MSKFNTEKATAEERAEELKSRTLKNQLELEMEFNAIPVLTEEGKISARIGFRDTRKAPADPTVTETSPQPTK